MICIIISCNCTFEPDKLEENTKGLMTNGVTKKVLFIYLIRRGRTQNWKVNVPFRHKQTSK